VCGQQWLDAGKPIASQVHGERVFLTSNWCSFSDAVAERSFATPKTLIKQASALFTIAASSQSSIMSIKFEIITSENIMISNLVDRNLTSLTALFKGLDVRTKQFWPVARPAVTNDSWLPAGVELDPESLGASPSP